MHITGFIQYKIFLFVGVVNSEIYHFFKYFENRDITKDVLRDKGLKKIRIGIEGNIKFFVQEYLIYLKVIGYHTCIRLLGEINLMFVVKMLWGFEEDLKLLTIYISFKYTSKMQNE